MSITDRLDEIQARADKATDGPWDEYDAQIRHTQIDGWTRPAERAAAQRQTAADIDFVMHARTDVPALVKALRLVLNRHSEHESMPGLCLWCEQPYPCSERRDVISALGVA